MTHLLIWMLLYPPLAAGTTAIDARSGLQYDNGGVRALMWMRLGTYLLGICLFATYAYV